MKHDLMKTNAMAAVVVIALNALACALLYSMVQSGRELSPLTWTPMLLSTAAGIGITISMTRSRSVAYAPLLVRALAGSAGKHPDEPTPPRHPL